MRLFRAVDELLNSITMYRVLVYGLSLLAALAVLFSYTGVMSLSGQGLIVSLVSLIVVCFGVNWALAKIWRAAASPESWLITALIIFFILPPTTTLARFLGAIGVGIVAMASKYLLAYRRKHIFNPAAIALVVGSLLGISSAVWWVGSKTLFPIVLPIGLLVLRKQRHLRLFLVFVTASLATSVAFALWNDPASISALSEVIKTAIFTSPLLFLGSIMLTEPATMPSSRNWRLLFAVAVGVVSAADWSLLGRSITAEMALSAGNILAFMVSPRYKAILRLIAKQPVSDGSLVYDFAFESSQKLRFTPGQYLELTVPHQSDSRGNRRIFTIASAPSEQQVHFGIKILPEGSSSYKRALLNLQPGQELIAGQLAGDFVLPKSRDAKLLFIAGGIGVTPFRSMAQSFIDDAEKRDAVLFYVMSGPSEFAYKDVFVAAAAYGLRTMPVIDGQQAPSNWKGMSGRLSAADLRRIVPDIAERRAYISGPPNMVDAYRRILVEVGVRRSNIVTDHFSGY